MHQFTRVDEYLRLEEEEEGDRARETGVTVEGWVRCSLCFRQVEDEFSPHGLCSLHRAKILRMWKTYKIPQKDGLDDVLPAESNPVPGRKHLLPTPAGKAPLLARPAPPRPYLLNPPTPMDCFVDCFEAWIKFMDGMMDRYMDRCH